VWGRDGDAGQLGQGARCASANCHPVRRWFQNSSVASLGSRIYRRVHALYRRSRHRTRSTLTRTRGVASCACESAWPRLYRLHIQDRLLLTHCSRCAAEIHALYLYLHGEHLRRKAGTHRKTCRTLIRLLTSHAMPRCAPPRPCAARAALPPPDRVDSPCLAHWVGGSQPGGHESCCPPSTCRCRWYTLWHPAAPSLTTTRYPSPSSSCRATTAAVYSRWPARRVTGGAEGSEISGPQTSDGSRGLGSQASGV